METFSALLALCARNSPVTGEFPAQRPVTRSFDVFFYLRLEKPLSKQSWGWWFETPSRSLWRHCNGFRQEQEGPDWWYLNICFIKCTIEIFQTHDLSIHKDGTDDALPWHHNERDGVSNHRRLDCLLKRLFRRRSTKTSNLRVTGLRDGKSPATGEFPAQMASDAENVSIGHWSCDDVRYRWLSYLMDLNGFAVNMIYHKTLQPVVMSEYFN